MNARDYLSLPWTIRGPSMVTDEHENTRFEMRVGELPDFLVAASSESEVLCEFKRSLLAFLESYTSQGEVLPLVPSPSRQSRRHPKLAADLNAGAPPLLCGAIFAYRRRRLIIVYLARPLIVR